MPKPCESWNSWVRALDETGLVLVQTPSSVETRIIEAKEASVIGAMLGVEGSSVERLRGSFRNRGGHLTDTRTGFRTTFTEDKFKPC